MDKKFISESDKAKEEIYVRVFNPLARRFQRIEFGSQISSIFQQYFEYYDENNKVKKEGG